jgi:hypothetical protein
MLFQRRPAAQFRYIRYIRIDRGQDGGTPVCRGGLYSGRLGAMEKGGSRARSGVLLRHHSVFGVIPGAYAAC